MSVGRIIQKVWSDRCRITCGNSECRAILEGENEHSLMMVAAYRGWRTGWTKHNLYCSNCASRYDKSRPLHRPYFSAKVTVSKFVGKTGRSFVLKTPQDGGTSLEFLFKQLGIKALNGDEYVIVAHRVKRMLKHERWLKGKGF